MMKTGAGIELQYDYKLFETFVLLSLTTQRIDFPRRNQNG